MYFKKSKPRPQMLMTFIKPTFPDEHMLYIMKNKKKVFIPIIYDKTLILNPT